MRIVLDTNVLVQALHNAKAGVVLKDPVTGNDVDRSEARAAALVEYVDVGGGTVLIPTPTLAEFLIGIEQGYYQKYLDVINGVSCFELFLSIRLPPLNVRVWSMTWK